MMWLITATLLLVPLVYCQNDTSIFSSSNTAVTSIAPSSVIMSSTPSTYTECPTPPTAGIVSGVAVGAFLMGLIIGALGVLLGLLAIKRPCSVDSHMSSSEKTQRFTRSETLSKKQSFNAISDAPPSSPLYHTKQETAAIDDNNDELETKDQLDETLEKSKGPLPPVPAPHAAAPLPPPTAPSTGRSKAAKPTSFTEEYDIPYVRSATKLSETPLEEYDIPDISTPLGLTVKPLSKSQTNITKEPSTATSVDKAKVIKKPLVPSKSLGNIAQNNDELPSEHYYVMDMNADAAVACTMPRINAQAHQHIMKPTPPRTRKPTNRHDQQHSSIPMQDPFSPPHVIKKPALRPPIPSPSSSSNKATITKAYSSKPIQQKPPLSHQVRSHSQSVLTSEPHQYKNIEGRNTDLTKQLKSRQAVKASVSTDPYSSGPAQYMNIGHRPAVASKRS